MLVDFYRTHIDIPIVDICEARCNFLVDIFLVLDPNTANSSTVSCTRADAICDHEFTFQVFAFFVDLVRLSLADYLALEARIVEICFHKKRLERGGGGVVIESATLDSDRAHGAPAKA